MIWIFLLLYTVFAYYFILKNPSNIRAKVNSLLSGAFILLIITPIWNFNLFTTLINISLFLPFGFGALGIVFGWFGVKEGIRGGLLFINVLAMLFYLFIMLIGTFGFQQP